MPTEIQAQQAVILIHWLSKGYQTVNVFRYDTKYKTIYIQAGENDDIALIINSKGEWNFVWIINV